MKCLAEPGMACENIVGWKANERRCRCSGHTINLAAAAFLKALGMPSRKALKAKLMELNLSQAADIDDDDEMIGLYAEEEEEVEVTQPDMVEAKDWDAGCILSKLFTLLRQVRSSPQARSYWLDCCHQLGLPALMLLLPPATRWSLAFDTVAQMIQLQPRVLAEPAAAQAVFSSETTPTVWKLLPTMEFMMSRLEDFVKDSAFAQIRDAIEASIKILKKYYKKADLTSVNVICLGMFPAVIVSIKN
ncbi:hypothetical protein M422DRAFT_42907 [Sphaerobolus stellatus SS14]|nr:hypothetical protein M422DRAFT_42907 [Sphaerobolus stellatus SS14]